MSRSEISEIIVSQQHAWALDALYDADGDFVEFCRSCGKALAEPPEESCGICELVGARMPVLDEGLLNP